MSKSPQFSRRTVLQGAGASALLMLIAACSDSAKNATAPGSTSPGATGPGTTAAGTTTTVAASAQDIELLTVALPSSLSNLYPGKEAGIFNYYVATLVSEGLVSPDSNGTLVPALAEKWEQPTPTTYVYTLRADAKFSDGTPVTADDIVYSVGLSKDDKVSPNTAYYWANVKSAAKTGANEVTITLTEPDVAFEWGPAASNALWVTSKKYVEAHKGELGTPTSLLFGTGPYKVTKFQPDSMVELERVDTWWGGKAPVKTVRINFIPEETTRILARKSGDVDLAISISLDQLKQWEGTDHTKVLTAPDRSYVGIDFNTAVAPFDDIHVRKAIAYACNRKAYVEKLLGGHGEVATALTTPLQLETIMSPTEARTALNLLDLPYDLDLAKAELAKSKVPTGFTTKVEISSSAPQVSSAFQALAQAVKPLGIIIDIKEVPVEEWYNTIASKDFGLAYMWYFNTTGDPAELATWFFGDGNPASYKNPAVTALMASSKKETDPKKRAQIIIDAQKTALADVPYVPLWWGEAAIAINDKYTVKDFGSYTFLSPWTPRILTVG